MLEQIYLTVTTIINSALKPFGLVLWGLYDMPEKDGKLCGPVRLTGIQVGRRFF